MFLALLVYIEEFNSRLNLGLPEEDEGKHKCHALGKYKGQPDSGVAEDKRKQKKTY